MNRNFTLSYLYTYTKMDTPQTHNQSIVAKWQVSSTVAKKRKPNSRISLNTPDDSPRALSPAPTGEQPIAGPSTPPIATTIAPTVPENQPVPRAKKLKTAAVNVEQLAAKYAPPTRKLNELGGLDEQIDQLLEVVGLPLRRPEMYFQMGTERPKGVLLHGVQGGGKTQLVNCLAGVSYFLHDKGLADSRHFNFHLLKFQHLQSFLGCLENRKRH
jgi:ribosome biogenesis ATPase